MLKIKNGYVLITEQLLISAVQKQASYNQKQRIKKLYDLSTVPTPEDILRLNGKKVTVNWWQSFLVDAPELTTEVNKQLTHIANYKQMITGRKEQAKKAKETKKGKRKKRTKASRRAERKEQAKSDNFYTTDKWRSLRWRVLQKHGFECQACGRSKKIHGVVLHVDHIKPKSTHPELAMCFENLQVLCEDCNLGKSNRSCEDLRPQA